MTEHEYNQNEKRRTEGTAGRRYQQGGRDDRQWDRQGGRTGQRSGQQSGHETGGRMGQQSSFGTGGQTSYGTGGQSGGGQSSFGPGSQTGQQTGSSTPGGTSGGQSSGRQMGGGQSSGQMGGGRTSSQMTGGRTGGQMGQSSGSFGSQTGGQQTGRMGGGQTSGGGMGGRTGQQTGQIGGQSSRQAPIQPVSVRDVAATDVVTVQPDAPLTEVVQKMRREDVGSVVVTDGASPIGIVTDRKIALALGETQDVSQLRAADLMSEDLVTVPEGTNVFDLVRRLGDKGVRRVPVVGDQGDLKGIVSLDDVVVLLAEEFYNVSQIVRQQSPRF